MRNRKALRLISMLLTLAMLLSSSAAMADIITVKNSVSAYAEPDGQNVALQIGAGTYDVSRYNNEYYQFTMSMGGATFPLYIKISDVASDSGDGSGSGTTPTTPDGNKTADTLLPGENDPTYEKEILNYTVPAAGLFLYASMTNTTPSTSIAAGEKVKLTYEAGTTVEDTWYSTWYNNMPYYVRKADLAMDTSAVAVGKTYALRLKKDVQLYSSISQSSDDPTGYVGNEYAKAGTLSGGMQVNVTVYQTKQLTVADEVGNNSTKTYATWFYFEPVSGTKQYFKNPEFDEIVKDLDGYNNIVTTSGVAYYATKDAAEEAMGKKFDESLVNIVNTKDDTFKFVVYSTPSTDTAKSTTFNCKVVYDLRAYTGYGSMGTSTSNVEFYACEYYDNNGRRATGYIEASKLSYGGTVAVKEGSFVIRSSASKANDNNIVDKASTKIRNLVQVDADFYVCQYLSSADGKSWRTGYVLIADADAVTSITQMSGFNPGGFLADTTGQNTAYGMMSNTLVYMYGQFDSGKSEKAYNRITNAIAIDQKDVPQIKLKDAGFYQSVYRDANNNRSEDKKTAFEHVYFKPVVTGVTEAKLQNAISVFTGISAASDLEKFPTGFCGTASAWQGLFDAKELTNRCNYKTQTKTVDGVTYYRVTWYRVQFMNKNGTMSTGYYENPAVYDSKAGEIGYGYYKLTSDTNAVGGDAFDTINGSGADTKLLKKLVSSDGKDVQLYTAKNKVGYYYTVSKDTVLYGVRSDDTWYEVIYSGKTYYVLADKVKVTGAVAVSDTTLASSSFYVTIGADGAQLYTSPGDTGSYYGSASRYLAYDETTGKLKILPAGKTVLVSKSSTGWYKYLEVKTDETTGVTTSTTYYIQSTSVSNVAASGTGSSWRAELNGATVYSSPNASGATARKLTGIYSVQEFNSEFFAIRLEGTRYYLRRDSSVTTGTMLPITTTGKSYSAVVGESGAYLFKTFDKAKDYNNDLSKDYAANDDKKPNPDGFVQTLQPGAKITVTQIDSYLFLMTTKTGNLYIALRDISAIVGNDDDGYNGKETPSSGVTADDVINGKTDANYTNTVLKYTVPAGGLWLYSAQSASSAQFSVAAGVTLNLSAADANERWYATWYNGKQYFVRVNDLQSNATIQQNGSYTIQIKSGVETFYKLTATTSATDDPYGTGLCGETKYSAGNISAGTYNVTVYKTTSFTAYNAATGSFEQVTLPTWYSFVNATGTTVYFQNPKLGNLGYDRRGNDSDNAFKTVLATGAKGTKLYYGISQIGAAKANGIYSKGTTSQTYVYGGMSVNDYTSGYALFQYDNYDTTATNGWQYGRTTNDKNHRGSDYNNAAWDRMVSYERVTDIKPYMYAVVTNAQGAKSYAVTWYSGTLYYNYNHSTKTYDGHRTVYFNTTNGSPVGDLNGGAILNATVTSGSDVNFTLSIPVKTNETKLYAECNNADTVISTTAQGAEEITYLPGIEYNSNWYKVAYNGEGWFVQKTDVKATGKTVIACATNGSLSTSTLTVTIGTSGARLYSKPETNSQPVYENTSGWLGGGASNRIRYAAYEQNRVGFLSAGTIVSASKYNDSWYTYGRNDGGVQTTYYFRAADVANSIDSSTVDSYILTIPTGIHEKQRIMLYSSMSTADSNPLATNEMLNPGTYNVRKMADVTWSRVLYKGLNYYFKTADAEKIFSFVAGSDGGVGLKVGETYVALKINETEASTYVGATDGSDGTRKGGKEVKFKIKDVAQGSGYTFTVSGDGITYYSDPAATVPEKTLPAGTYEAKAVSASVYSIILGGKTYYVRKADIESKKISFTTKACLDIYNAARQVVYGADEYDASGNALGLPVGTYETGKSVNGYEVVSSDGTWIELSKSGATYYIKASDITRYTQLSVSGPSHKLNVSGSYYYGSGSITAESDVNFYNPSAVSTSAATQTKYLSQRLGALASATPINQTGVNAKALEWAGVYNKVVKINDNWAAVTIPEADPINGTTPNVKYDSTSKTYTITTGATRYAGNTYYVYIGGKTVDPAGSINSVNATENGGVTSAIGGAIATVNDGKTYTITIGANGAKVYNNAKLEPSNSTEVVQTIAAGTRLAGTKLTAAYLDGTEYRFQSVYKITYNGYTAYISAGDVAGVEKGDDEQEREDEKNKDKLTPDTGDDSEPLDINVGDPELTVVLATTIVAYGSREANVASAINIPAGTTVGVTKVDENWYQLRLTNGNICYIRVKDLTMEDVASTERITDGTGYITKLLTVNVSSGSSLNMRKTASTGGTILAYLQNGTYLTNMGYTKDANGAIWYRVSYNGITGYVHGNYVAPVLSGSSDKNSADSLRENVGLALTVNTDNVYIRTGAGPENPTIDRLAKGSIVVPTEAVQGSDGLTWYKITYNGTNAYIRYDYVSGGTSNGGSLSGNAAIRLNSTNLRSGAGMSFQVVARLKKNAVVTILSTSTDSEGTIWYRITSADKSGYVRGDMLRSLTNDESADLINGVIGSYKVLKVGSRGSEVTALQQALINKGFLGQGEADGIYGSKTMAAVKAFQTANSLTANGIADATTQAKLYGKGNAGDMKGNVFSLDWFADGYTLINAFPNISVYDCNTGVTWNAKYINGKNHADVIPASATDAQLLTAYSITGSYVRRPCIITINGTKYAGSMYAVGHGTTNYCSWFSGVMCIHFTGSKTHTSGRVDADHQKAIQSVLTNFN